MMYSNRKSFIVVAAAALISLAGWTSGAFAEVSFEGKSIHMGIGSSPAGGTDLAARLAARVLEKYLPGNPTVIVRNFGAGGGKIRAANYLALEAPTDGTWVLGLDTSPIRPSTVMRKVARYDPRKFHAVGGVNRGGSVILIRKDAHPRLEDPNAKPVIVGAIAGTRTWQTMLMMGKEYLGWNVRWVPGYKGTSSMVKALRQGEIDVLATNNAYIIDGMVKDGIVDLLAQEGQVAGAGYKPRITFPDVPLFPVMFEAANPPKLAVHAYNAVMKPTAADKWVALPPGTAADIVQAYRMAFAKGVKDPEYLEVAKKQLSPEIYYMSGEELEAIINSSLDTPEEAVEFVSKLRKKFGVSSR